MELLDATVGMFADMEPWQGDVRADCFPSYLGVMTETAFVAEQAPSNQLLPVNNQGSAPPPTFANGEVFYEQAAIHRAVQDAKGQFNMLELGGGFAARTVDAHAALQRDNPLPCRFVVVEAEPTHFEWAKRHMRNNGIDPDAHWLINALVGIDTMPKLFLLGEGFYGNSIASDEIITQFLSNLAKGGMVEAAMGRLLRHGSCGVQQPFDVADGVRNFDFGFVSSIPLVDILQTLEHVDLMDVDIQGGEAEVLPAAMDAINKQVERIHLATHGKELHSHMWDLFFDHGWMCETDLAPNILHRSKWGSFETSDGILDLVNLNLG